MLDRHYHLFTCDKAFETRIEWLRALKNCRVGAVPYDVLGSGKQLFHQRILPAHLDVYVPIPDATGATLLFLSYKPVYSRERIT